MTGTAAFVQWYAKMRYNMDLPAEVILYLSTILNTVAHAMTVALVAIWGFVCTQAVARYGAPTISGSPAPTIVTREAGFVRLPALLVIATGAALCLALSGCGTINAWMAAKTKIVEQDYAGAKKQKQNDDDAALQLWIDTSCAVNVGALQRNPDALTPVMDACPVTGMAKVTTKSGTVSLQLPNTVPLTQQPAAPVSALATPAMTSTTVLSTTPDQTQQLMNQILQTLQAIQTSTAGNHVPASAVPAPTVKAQPRTAAAKVTPAAPKPVAITAPAPATPIPAPALTAAPSTQAGPAINPTAPASGLGSFITPAAVPK